MKPLEKSINQSTQVAFLVIEEMAAIGEPIELTTLARRLDMPKPRMFRYLRTLLSIGYVLQDPVTDRYRLSLKLYHVGQAIADKTNLLSEARPLMVELSNATEQTTTLSIIEPEGMRVLDIIRAPSPVQIVTRPGALLDFHSSAQGKVALAFGPPALWDVVRTRPLKQWTEKTNTDIPALEAEVAEVRVHGWADAPEQTLMGVTAVSAPIFDKVGQMTATITIAGPTVAIPSPPRPAQIAAVLRAARMLSQNLGHAEAAE